MVYAWFLLLWIFAKPFDDILALIQRAAVDKEAGDLSFSSDLNQSLLVFRAQVDVADLDICPSLFFNLLLHQMAVGAGGSHKKFELHLISSLQVLFYCRCAAPLSGRGTGMSHFSHFFRLGIFDLFPLYSRSQRNGVSDVVKII